MVMRGLVKQLDNWQCKPGEKKFTKKLARKAMRRLGKLLLDDAPKKLKYRGYVS
jgi:uncharacterized protein with von Willebrand factor type A (vWA) domain